MGRADAPPRRNVSDTSSECPRRILAGMLVLQYVDRTGRKRIDWSFIIFAAVTLIAVSLLLSFRFAVYLCAFELLLRSIERAKRAKAQAAAHGEMSADDASKPPKL